MRKKHKRVLGFLGLTVVAGMTAFAACLPSPEALAQSTMVTDSIVVTVISSKPDVNITAPASGLSFTKPLQNINFNYNNVNDVILTMEKTMSTGTPQVYPLFNTNANMQPGNGSMNVDFSESQYGYGEYTIRIKGESVTGEVDEDVVNIVYWPVKAEVKEDDNTGEIFAELEYDDNNNDLDHFIINIYDEDGNQISQIPPIRVEKGEKKVKLPFAENGVPSGRYIVSVSAYDDNDNIFYKSYDVVFLFKSIPVPDTGGLLKGLNISKVDYLTTGLIVFGLVGLFGILFIVKDRKSSRKKR